MERGGHQLGWVPKWSVLEGAMTVLGAGMGRERWEGQLEGGERLPAAKAPPSSFVILL